MESLVKPYFRESDVPIQNCIIGLSFLDVNSAILSYVVSSILKQKEEYDEFRKHNSSYCRLLYFDQSDFGIFCESLLVPVHNVRRSKSFSICLHQVVFDGGYFEENGV